LAHLRHLCLREGSSMDYLLTQNNSGFAKSFFTRGQL